MKDELLTRRPVRANNSDLLLHSLPGILSELEEFSKASTLDIKPVLDVDVVGVKRRELSVNNPPALPLRIGKRNRSIQPPKISSGGRQISYIRGAKIYV